MTTNELYAELVGTKCRCGRAKKKMQTFCGGCYAALETATQKSLYNRFGHGYEGSYDAAVAELVKGGK